MLLVGSILPLRSWRQREPVNPVVATLPYVPGVRSLRLPVHVVKAGSYTFSVAVDDQPTLPSDDSNPIGCLLGMLHDQGDTAFHCEQFGQPLTLDWVVRDASGAARAHGHHPPAPGSGTVDDEDRKRVSGTFAELQLPVGEDVLEVTGLHLPANLVPLHPSFDCVFNNEHYDYYNDWIRLFLTLGSLLVAAIGVGLLLAGLVRWSSSRGAARITPDD